MRRKTTVNSFNAGHLKQLVLPVILISIAAVYPYDAQGMTCRSELQCLECNVTTNNEQYCTKCGLGNGLLIQPPNPTTCQKCGTRCAACNVIGQVCQQCVATYGPIFSSNNTGNCGPCVSIADNCVGGCGVNGAGKCDQCNTGFGLTNGNTTCFPCVPHCNLCNTNITYCDVCSFGYVFYANKTCGLCSDYCIQYKCLQNGAGKCDRCDDGFGLTTTNTCAPSTIHDSSGTTNSRITPNIIFEPATFWTSISTTLATSVLGIDLHVEIADGEYLPCPMLEVGLGLGIPCGIIIIVLLIIVIFLCVQNKSLRKFKRQNQDNRQSHSKDSSASNGTTQLPMTAYQHLDARNSKRQYDVIDRYDTISTTTTENTGHYETPLN